MVLTLNAFSTDLVSHYGVVGVALAMTLESAGIPIPSEVVMPLAGFVSRSPMGLATMIAAGLLGNLVGSWIGYGIGHGVGQSGHKPRSWLAKRHWDRAQQWFARHGNAAVFIGRVVPVVRTYISFPAGAADMPLGRFTAYTALGSVLWSAVLASLGYALGSRWQEISPWFTRYTAITLTFVVVAGLVWVWRYRHSRA